MTGAIDIEHARKPAVGDKSWVDIAPGKFNNPRPIKLVTDCWFLYRPTVDEISMSNKNEGRRAKERMHSHTGGTIHRATKSLTYGEDGIAKHGKGRLPIMGAFEKENGCETLLSHHKLIQKLESPTAVEAKLITRDCRSP